MIFFVLETTCERSENHVGESPIVDGKACMRVHWVSTYHLRPLLLHEPDGYNTRFDSVCSVYGAVLY